MANRPQSDRMRDWIRQPEEAARMLLKREAAWACADGGQRAWGVGFGRLACIGEPKSARGEFARCFLAPPEGAPGGGWGCVGASESWREGKAARRREPRGRNHHPVGCWQGVAVVKACRWSASHRPVSWLGVGTSGTHTAPQKGTRLFSAGGHRQPRVPWTRGVCLNDSRKSRRAGKVVRRPPRDINGRKHLINGMAASAHFVEKRPSGPGGLNRQAGTRHNRYTLQKGRRALGSPTGARTVCLAAVNNPGAARVVIGIRMLWAPARAGGEACACPSRSRPRCPCQSG